MLLRVREFRTKAGLRQTDLAALSSCSREAISKIENGHRCPNVQLLARIALALQVPLWTLLDDTQASTASPV